MLVIFTPTYNRVNQLEILYNSLKRQTNKSFYWLVIDDGSEDSTYEKILEWKEENIISIKYIHQLNSGKHIAYNNAICNMNELWHVTIDSDDWLEDNAVEIFLTEAVKINDNNSCVGVVFPRTNKINNKNIFPNTDKLNITDLQVYYNLKIETTILIKNQYLSGFCFLKFPDEKFMPEDALYVWLSNKGYFKVVNKHVCNFEYLKEGLTKSVFTLWDKNRRGVIYSLEARKKYILENLTGFKKNKELVKVNINIETLKFRENKNKYIQNIPKYKILMLFIIVLWDKIRFK